MDNLVAAAFAFAAEHSPHWYEFRVHLRRGAILEGAPEEDYSDGVLRLASGAHIRTSDIAAIEVLALEDEGGHA